MLDAVRHIYNPIIKTAMVANAIGTIVIFALVAIMNVDVIARGAFHAPLRGVVEVVIFSLVLIVFLQLPDVVYHNRLTRSDGFITLAEKHFSRIGWFFKTAINIAAFIFMSLATWTIWPEAIESVETCNYSGAFSADGSLFAALSAANTSCEYFGTPGIFTAPWWPVKLVVASSLTLCGIIFLFKTILGDKPTGKTS